MDANEFRLPQWDCIDAGDPYWRVIEEYDEVIYEYQSVNRDLVGVSVEDGRQIAFRAERLQLDFELEHLERWWRLS